MQCSLLHCRLCSSWALSPPPFITLTCSFPGTHSAQHHTMGCIPDPYAVACLGCNCVYRLLPHSQVGNEPLGTCPGHLRHTRHVHIEGADGRGGLKVSLCLSSSEHQQIQCPEWKRVTLPPVCCKAMCGSRMRTSTCYRYMGTGMEERCGHSPCELKVEIG